MHTHIHTRAQFKGLFITSRTYHTALPTYVRPSANRPAIIRTKDLHLWVNTVHKVEQFVP